MPWNVTNARMLLINMSTAQEMIHRQNQAYSDFLLSGLTDRHITPNSREPILYKYSTKWI